MYPILNKQYMLLRQYGESTIYPLVSHIQGQETTSKYVYEKINRTACEILELCDGSNDMEDIARIMSDKYNENFEKAMTFVDSFIKQAVSRGFVSFSMTRQKTAINISGDYETIFPFNVQFEITKACPLRCSHCFNNSGEMRTNELSTREIKAVFNKLEAMGVKKIMITGGEPTIRKDFLEIVAYASGKFIGISVASNGYCFTPEMAEKISKYKNVVVQISIDGTEEHHNLIRGIPDSFEKATNAVKLLAKHGVRVIVASTFNNINYNDIDFVTALAKDLGAVQITYGVTFNIGRAKNNNLIDNLDVQSLMQKSLEMRQKYSDHRFYVNAQDISDEGLKKKATTCGRGTSQICIRENGDVSPCLQFNLVYLE